jgi:hypothetical protein
MYFHGPRYNSNSVLWAVYAQCIYRTASAASLTFRIMTNFTQHCGEYFTYGYVTLLLRRLIKTVRQGPISCWKNVKQPEFSVALHEVGKMFAVNLGLCCYPKKNFDLVTALESATTFYWLLKTNCEQGRKVFFLNSLWMWLPCAVTLMSSGQSHVWETWPKITPYYWLPYLSSITRQLHWLLYRWGCGGRWPWSDPVVFSVAGGIELPDRWAYSNQVHMRQNYVCRLRHHSAPVEGLCLEGDCS